MLQDTYEQEKTVPENYKQNQAKPPIAVDKQELSKEETLKNLNTIKEKISKAEQDFDILSLKKLFEEKQNLALHLENLQEENKPEEKIIKPLEKDLPFEQFALQALNKENPQDNTRPLTLKEARQTLKYKLLKDYITTLPTSQREEFLKTELNLEEDIKTKLYKDFEVEGL